jgi:hypothetical protein
LTEVNELVATREPTMSYCGGVLGCLNIFVLSLRHPIVCFELILYLCLKWNEKHIFSEMILYLLSLSISEMQHFLCKFWQHVSIQQQYEGWNNIDIKVKKVMKPQHI